MLKEGHAWGKGGLQVAERQGDNTHRPACCTASCLLLLVSSGCQAIKTLTQLNPAAPNTPHKVPWTHLLLNGVVRAEAEHLHLLLLTNAMGSVHGLQIHLLRHTPGDRGGRGGRQKRKVHSR